VFLTLATRLVLALPLHLQAEFVFEECRSEISTRC